MDDGAGLDVDLEVLFAPDSVDDESVEVVDDPNMNIVLDSDDDDRNKFGGSDRFNCVRNKRNGEWNSSCLKIRKQPRAGCLWRNSQKVSRQSAIPPITGACKIQFSQTDNKVAQAENEPMIDFSRQVVNQGNNRRKQSEALSNHMEEIGMKHVQQELFTRYEPDGRRLSSNNSATTDGGKDVPLVTSVHEHVGLCYMDSQDPEEISVSEPLSFVDHYLSLNNFNLCDSEKDSPRKSKQIINLPILNKKGLQSLARKANIKRSEEYATFDWDEGQDREESFSLKEGSQLSHEFYKSETATINQDTDVTNCPECVDICSNEIISGHVVSVVRQGLKGDNDKILLVSELNPNANCAKELVGDVNIISPELHLANNEDEDDGEDFSTGVGFNTQLAAEAMEALLHAPPVTNGCYTHKIPLGIIDQSSEVVAMFKKTGNDTKTTTGKHIKSKRSAKKLYGNEGCPSAGFDQYLRGRPKLSPPENHKSTKRFTDNIIVYTRRTKSESVSKCSCSVPARLGKDDHIEKTITFDNIINIAHNSERVMFDRGCKIASSELNICNKCDESNIKQKEKSVSPISGELRQLGSNKSQLDFKPRDSRRWSSSACVSILFSQNLSNKTIRQLKKILARLGFSEVSYCAAATHFIADKFVRTKNMLEAIAFGKLVVTPSWLESCGQAGYSIAEKSYILRDARKEKEIGFSMPVSLARASQRPLLLGQRVLITPNVKPNKALIQTLVKAVHGQEVEDFQLEETKYDTVSTDLLIISCEEDYGNCEPFLDRGVPIYCSELLLNGIIIQKLQYERHRIMMNYIK